MDDFVIITEELHDDFDKFMAALPSCESSYLQLGSLLQHWNWHVQDSPALVTILFENQYVVLHYSEMDELCEWVIKTREEYGSKLTWAHILDCKMKARRSETSPTVTRSCGKWLVTFNCMKQTGTVYIYIAMLCQLYYSLFYYRKVLESEHEWVNDRIINATQNLTKCLYGTPGLQDTLLVGIKACDAVGRNEFVQVLHSGGNHWLTISSIHCPYSTINVYDSLHSTIPEATIKSICTFLMCSESHINVRIMDTDTQENASDCGIYSLAFSTALCAGEDPQCLQFIQSLMRQHLLKCLKSGKMEPFPSKKVRGRKNVLKNLQIPIYCTCRNIKNGNMVACEGCDEQFHEECIKVPSGIGKEPQTGWTCDSYIAQINTSH